jgi:hypothetical protein
VFDSIAHVVSGSPWTYVLLGGCRRRRRRVAGAPGETMVIAAAVLAAQGHLDIVFVVIAAAFGRSSATMDAPDLAQQTLQSSAAKALKALTPRPRVHALRLHHPARPAQHGSRAPWG